MPKINIRKAAPLYRQIADQLRDDIFINYLPGDELPGDNELSRKLKISSLTVREAMAVLVEEGLLKRRIGSGTRVAMPRIGRYQSVAVLIDKDLAHPLFPLHYLPIYEHIRRLFSQSGIYVRLYTGIEKPNTFQGKISSEEFIADLTGGRIAAVINLVAFPEERFLEHAAKHGIPWVYFGRFGDAPIKLQHDMESDLDAMIEALARQGKRRAALLGWQGFWGTDLRLAERTHWFKSAVDRHNMVTRDEWVRMDLYPQLAGAGWSQIRTLWTASAEKPDAVVFLDDSLYLDALPALSRLNLRVPQDLAIGVLTLRLAHLPVESPMIVEEIDVQNLSRIVHDCVLDSLNTGIVRPSTHRLSARLLTVGSFDGSSSYQEFAPQTA